MQCTRSSSCLRSPRARAGISDAHRRAGEEDVAAHAGVKEALAGLARADTRPQRQAKPLNAEGPGDPPSGRQAGRVDVAICVVLRDGLLRWEDVTFQASGAKGALLEVRRSKTDPQALAFGISDGQVGRRVRAAARAAGLGEDFSGHSGRIGMARRMVAAGAPTAAIQHQGR